MHFRMTCFVVAALALLAQVQGLQKGSYSSVVLGKVRTMQPRRGAEEKTTERSVGSVAVNAHGNMATTPQDGEKPEDLKRRLAKISQERPTLGSQVVILDTENTRQFFPQGIGKEFTIVVDFHDRARGKHGPTPYQVQDGPHGIWFYRDDVKLVQEPSAWQDRHGVAWRQRPTVDSHVFLLSTHNTREHFAQGIGKQFVIVNDAKDHMPYQLQGEEEVPAGLRFYRTDVRNVGEATEAQAEAKQHAAALVASHKQSQSNAAEAVGMETQTAPRQATSEGSFLEGSSQTAVGGSAPPMTKLFNAAQMSM